MDMTGEYRIAASRQKVWEALNDSEILRQSIVGCDEIVKLSDTEMTAKVTAKVGPVKAKFGGKVTLSDLDPPNGYTITGEGSGGAAGFAKGGATVKLQEVDGGQATILSYTVRANVGGKLAQIGSRLIDATARKMADDFFTRFGTIVGGGAPTAVGVDAPAETPMAGDSTAEIAADPVPAVEPDVRPAPHVVSGPPPATSYAPTPRPALSPATWVAGVTVVIVAILLLVLYAR